MTCTVEAAPMAVAKAAVSRRSARAISQPMARRGDAFAALRRIARTGRLDWRRVRAVAWPTLPEAPIMANMVCWEGCGAFIVRVKGSARR